MMNYDETQQKLILRNMDKELLALLAIDMATDDFEVIYSDGTWREFEDRYRRKDFFAMWRRDAIPLICEVDRERMCEEIQKEFLLKKLKKEDEYSTLCRFIVTGRPAWCRIKVAADIVEQGNLVMSIRNADREMAELSVQRRREQDMRELEEMLRQMRMKNSVSQMHPHFLFNSLSSIREIVLTDPEYGADLLYDFTTHLRAGIRAMSNDEKIWFSQEMENIRAYVNIEKMRFGGRLTVKYELKAPDFQILPLSIQPLIENAIKHGLFEKEGEGTVWLKTGETREGVEILVEDDGVGFDPVKTRREIEEGKRDSTGLQNLIFRLEKTMHAGVELDSAIGRGTRVRILLPVS